MRFGEDRDERFYQNAIRTALQQINGKLDKLEELMSDVSNDQTHLDTDVTALTTQFAAVVAELKSQVTAGLALDFTRADALVASVTAEAAADAPPVVVPPAG